jgi:3D (Asp-Asp-Asp) domain-containing protein
MAGYQQGMLITISTERMRLNPDGVALLTFFKGGKMKAAEVRQRVMRGSASASGPRCFFRLTVAVVVFCGLAAMGAGFDSGYLHVTSLANTVSAAPMPADSTPGDSMEEWKTVHMRVTAYCPCSHCCGEYADGITASGHHIEQGDRFAAADRRYGFGTVLIIPGYNGSAPVKVLDRGGAIKGDKLDVFFNTHQEALEWGVQYLDVKVRQ